MSDFDVSTARDAAWLDAERTRFRVTINDVVIDNAAAMPGLLLYDAMIAAEVPIAEFVPDLVAYAADARWRRETGGTTWGGWPIHTDAIAQTKYLAELQAISLGVRADGDAWKFRDGVFRSVSNADFPQLAVAARAHVRTCFAVEGSVLAAIAAGTISTTAEIDAAFAAV